MRPLRTLDGPGVQPNEDESSSSGEDPWLAVFRRRKEGKRERGGTIERSDCRLRKREGRPRVKMRVEEEEEGRGALQPRLQKGQ